MFPLVTVSLAICFTAAILYGLVVFRIHLCSTRTCRVQLSSYIGPTVPSDEFNAALRVYLVGVAVISLAMFSDWPFVVFFAAHIVISSRTWSFDGRRLPNVDDLCFAGLSRAVKKIAIWDRLHDYLKPPLGRCHWLKIPSGLR